MSFLFGWIEALVVDMNLFVWLGKVCQTSPSFDWSNAPALLEEALTFDFDAAWFVLSFSVLVCR